MSKIIADILQAKQPDFQHKLQDFEIKLGSPAHDVKVVGDIRSRSVSLLKARGVDTSDTTPKEVYFTLQELARTQNADLSSALGLDAASSPDDIVKSVITFVLDNVERQTTWCYKSASLRKLLKKQPPKQLMKVLGLRSVDSMLKRNNPEELLCLARTIESPEWNIKFNTHFKKAKVIDFDSRKFTVTIIPVERRIKLEKSGYHGSRLILTDPLCGSVLLAVPGQRFKLDVLTLTAALVETFAELRRVSAYLRTISVRADFGPQVYSLLKQGLPRASHMLAQTAWNNIYRGLVGNEVVLAEIEQPYLSAEDFGHTSISDILNKQVSNPINWEQHDFVFYHVSEQKPVSFHLLDVLTNGSNTLTYEQSTVQYGQARLSDELWSRYHKHPQNAKAIMVILQGEDILVV